MGRAARARVESQFSVAASVATAEQALLDVVAAAERPINAPAIPRAV
jgi:hypothetical protein